MITWDRATRCLEDFLIGGSHPTERSLSVDDRAVAYQNGMSGVRIYCLWVWLEGSPCRYFRENPARTCPPGVDWDASGTNRLVLCRPESMLVSCLRGLGKCSFPVGVMEDFPDWVVKKFPSSMCLCYWAPYVCERMA